MQSYSLTHVSDAVLLRDLAALIARDRMTTAEILAHIAEVDARRLYAPAGYSSMHAYCVGELRLSEDAAFKRIQAARAARRFPELLSAVALGKLHLIGVCLLAPHLNPENTQELIEGSAGKRRLELEAWLATRFTRRSEPIEFASAQLATSQVANDVVDSSTGSVEVATSQVEPRCSKRPEAVMVRARLSRTKLRYAQALLSHALPSGDVDQVLDRALDALIQQLERRKIGITAQPRKARPSVCNRHVSAEIRREVWARDGGRCTFVSANGTRCGTRRFLEFDHVEPISRGGTAAIDNLRLRCRAHNQYEAERCFGVEFMRQRRRHSERGFGTEGYSQARDVLTGLRNLGCRPSDARRAAEYAASLPLSTLEERMRAALQFIGGRLISNRPLPAG